MPSVVATAVVETRCLLSGILGEMLRCGISLVLTGRLRSPLGPGRVKTSAPAARVEYLGRICASRESIHSAHTQLDRLLENCIFHISPTYEFSHSLGQDRQIDRVRPTSACPPIATGHERSEGFRSRASQLSGGPTPCCCSIRWDFRRKRFRSSDCPAHRSASRSKGW